MQLKLERAEMVLHEFMDRTLDLCNAKQPMTYAICAHYLKSNLILGDIATDYLFEIRKALNALEDLAQAGLKIKRGEIDD